MQRRKNIIAESSAYGMKWEHLCKICDEQHLAFLQLLDTRPAFPSVGRAEVEVMSRLIGEKRRERLDTSLQQLLALDPSPQIGKLRIMLAQSYQSHEKRVRSASSIPSLQI